MSSLSREGDTIQNLGLMSSDVGKRVLYATSLKLLNQGQLNTSIVSSNNLFALAPILRSV